MFTSLNAISATPLTDWETQIMTLMEVTWQSRSDSGQPSQYLHFFQSQLYKIIEYVTNLNLRLRKLCFKNYLLCRR